jgi:hypothetical protein
MSRKNDFPENKLRFFICQFYRYFNCKLYRKFQHNPRIRSRDMIYPGKINYLSHRYSGSSCSIRRSPRRPRSSSAADTSGYFFLRRNFSTASARDEWRRSERYDNFEISFHLVCLPSGLPRIFSASRWCSLNYKSCRSVWCFVEKQWPLSRV